MAKFFEAHGRIFKLKTFICRTWHGSVDRTAEFPFRFLDANSQIAKLRLDGETPASLLGDGVLPLLVHSFSNLTSLALGWKGTEIPEQSLFLISKLTTLEQLHLSVGFQYGWRHEWLIDHSMMLKYLSPLSALQKVAFSRDSYKNGVTGGFSDYYHVGVLGIDSLEMGDDWTRETFEERHQHRMLKEAALYAENFPKLGWLYFGEIQMAVEKGENYRGEDGKGFFGQAG